ncbi:hypothetical protein [Dactylosporangium sp. NPDC005555]|uniref:hypothetical protein n=1 Tax=Dactylosporangium sp. NPDC005555 TaxID=3154889 RepID=UPI0033B63C2A
MTGLGAFLRGVDGRVADPAGPGDQGDPATRRGALVPPGAPGFAACLEPGVRDLVLAVLDAWDCLTYSSCEGHPGGGGRSPAPCEIGILPRDDEERHSIERRARRLAASFASASVELLYETTPLTSPVGSHPAVQLVFWPKDGWDSYFARLSGAVAEARRCLS